MDFKNKLGYDLIIGKQIETMALFQTSFVCQYQKSPEFIEVCYPNACKE